MGDTGAPSGEFAPATAATPVGDLVPFMGCLCCFTSCYTEWPACFGCAGKEVCLCFYAEFAACKFPQEGEEIYLLCSKGKSVCAPYKVCCSVSVIGESIFFIE